MDSNKLIKVKMSKKVKQYKDYINDAVERGDISRIDGDKYIAQCRNNNVGVVNGTIQKAIDGNSWQRTRHGH